MYAEPRSSLLSRPGPLLAVVGIHVAIAYVLSVSMGVIDLPKFIEPAQVVFIPEPEQAVQEPEIQVKPEIDQLTVDNPEPTSIPDEIIVPPAETPMPASENAVAATEAPAAAAGPPAQDLRTKTRVEPTYPPAARRAGEEGTVRLRILVDERGIPRDIQIAQGSGFARLDQAAIDAVRKWRFIAANSGSQAISAWTQVAITFRLTAGQ
ncbi:MAG TPA: TonB family protein [Povalibacter sp.]|uniref:energy transducer TonB n=1 Tax=Povalibacter sp. TaxID=1962978 RepID=UPI002C6DD61E|nr:TonB family protein [Povalibacter sp.]HMN43722.1 TonB family protein [Povalibacter sp.]